MRNHKALCIFLLGILYPFVQGDDVGYKLLDKCARLDGIKYQFEYHCPRNNDENFIVIHATPDKYVEIDCYDLTEFDTSILMNINAGELISFEIKNCPLPKDGISVIKEKINITKVDYFWFEEAYQNSETKIITKEFFNGLSEIKELRLTLFRSRLDDKFLEALPNLTELHLEKCRIQKIVHMFQYTPKLQILQIFQSDIANVPDEAFKYLPDLQELIMWNSNLSSLNKDAFTGLSQLKSLELSYNKITYLHEDIFKELKTLRNISIRTNNLSFISPHIFKYNKALEVIRFGNNPNLNLSDYVFANLTNLTNINIDICNLKSLPSHIFEGSINLLHISLRQNKLTQLQENVFRELRRLSTLDLSENQISHLPSKIFFSLEKLKILHLEYNKLTSIDDTLFKNVASLEIANLKNNEITTIHLRAFDNLKELIELDLSSNKYPLNYSHVDGWSFNPFINCEKLQKLNLSHNLIEEFPEGIMEKKSSLKYLNFQNNRLQSISVASLIKVSKYEVEVYLNNNNISVVDFGFYLFNTNKDEPSTVVYIYNNPINCDCSNLDLIKYSSKTLNPELYTTIDIRLDNVQCSSPRAFKQMFVKDLKPYQIICPLQEVGCPKKCICDFRPYDNTAVVNCAFRNLSKIPKMHLTNKFVQQIEINLEGNMIEAGPYSGIGYENVTKLDLSNNIIRNLSWVPSNIKVLKLNGNKLKFIESKILQFLNESTSFQNLTLYGNPWSCGCSAADLQNFLRVNYKKVHTDDVICEDNKQPLVNRKELCKSHLTIALAIAVPVFMLLFIAALLTALYFYYQENIKVWLYAKNLCLWFVTEEELDKDKTYDVFISYSHKDEEFVIQNLLPVLEAGPNPFKICIHVRDFIPGEFITTQVTNSVLDSRRTLVVLSENFLESVWGKMEFRAAHTLAIKEGRARVIVVKYGKLNEEKLDDELKAYLKTNTYVEWGDPWFWNKLKYALPHTAKRTFYNKQKHAHIMLKIDDKFELVTPAPTTQAESTPPVISLESDLLKNHPLNLNNLNDVDKKLLQNHP